MVVLVVTVVFSYKSGGEEVEEVVAFVAMEITKKTGDGYPT